MPTAEKTVKERDCTQMPVAKKDRKNRPKMPVAKKKKTKRKLAALIKQTNEKWLP